ncbi:MAG: insulinase family protein [Gammaproteobacteria bacterium HGW-Gammaproteobacteria-8]|nr:MAG: insulinase family protein [Gammaproteobacteria bacterium HGW-Gammaproteobacteria-8]
MNKTMRFASALVLVLAAFAAVAQESTPEFVTEVEGIREFRLDNGMKVLLMPDASRPTTTVNVTYFVGSKHESYGESGMAHLLEHLVFMGTPTHENIKKEISERGGFANGTTWWERTNYFQTLPAEDENLEWAIRMEADRMINSFIAAEDLESEMTVVRNEFEIGENSPFRVLLQRVMATAYEWHGYGRSTIGARADLENVPIERLQRFYRTWYQPDNAMVVISGKFEEARALELVQQYFGAIPAPERTLDNKLWNTYTRDPSQDGAREITVRRAGGTPTLMAAFHVPSALHEDFAAVEALGFVLGDTPSGRLYKALVEPGLASSVGAFVFRLPEPSLMLLFADLPEAGDIDRVREVTLQTVAALTDNPPTEEEVQRAVAALTSQMERGLNDSSQVGIGLSEWAATGDWRMLFLHRDRLEAVTAADVVAAASRYIVRDNRTVGIYLPESEPQRAEIAPAPAPETLLAGYTGREGRAEGEVFEATPENIEARVQRFSLSNGTKVALLPKATRGERVRANFVMRIGSLETLEGLGLVPAATAALLDRGTSQYTRQQLADRIDQLQAGLNLGGSTSVSASLDTRRENLAAVIDLIAEVARNPVFPEAELEEYKRQRLTALDQAVSEPNAVASRMSARHTQGDRPATHPDYTPSFAEERARIEALKVEELREFHRRFYGFGPAATIAIVGDFDPAAVREQLEQRFGDWQPQIAFQRWANDYQPVETRRMVEQLDDKASALLFGTQGMALTDTDPDYIALDLTGYLLGGGFLNSRLGNRIRNEEGLSYAVGGGFSAHPIDRSGSFVAFAMFAPENRERLETVLREELVKVVEQGFTAEELESGRTGLLQQKRLMRSDDGRLASILGSGLYLGRDLFDAAAREQRLAELTLDELNAAVRRWLDPDAISYAIAGDFSADESAEAGE